MRKTLACLDALLIATPIIIGTAAIMPFVVYGFAKELVRERYESRD